MRRLFSYNPRLLYRERQKLNDKMNYIMLLKEHRKFKDD